MQSAQLAIIRKSVLRMIPELITVLYVAGSGITIDS